MSALRTIALTAIGSALGRAVYENREAIKTKLTEFRDELEKQRLFDRAKAEADKLGGNDLGAAWTDMMKEWKKAGEKAKTDEPVDPKSGFTESQIRAMQERKQQ